MPLTTRLAAESGPARHSTWPVRASTMKIPRPMVRDTVVLVPPAGGQLAEVIGMGNTTFVLAVTEVALQLVTAQGWKSSTAGSYPAANISNSLPGNALR